MTENKYQPKTFTLLDEQVDSIVIQELQITLEYAERDLKRRKAGKGGAIFDQDIQKDIAEIKRHIDAFKTVLHYWGANA